jgi:hypothetical protein
MKKIDAVRINPDQAYYPVKKRRHDNLQFIPYGAAQQKDYQQRTERYVNQRQTDGLEKKPRVRIKMMNERIGNNK